MFEVLRGSEPPQVGQVERCPGVRLHSGVRVVSLHLQLLQEKEEAGHFLGHYAGEVLNLAEHLQRALYQARCCYRQWKSPAPDRGCRG